MSDTELRNQILAEEAELVFARFTEEDALALGTRIAQKGLKDGLPILIEISRFDRRLYFCALPGTTPDNEDWARRKANLVRHFHRSSLAVGLDLAIAGTDLTTKYGLSQADYAAHGGGFPLRVEGAGVIGSVVVSGLPQKEDHRLVVQALRDHLKA